MTVHFHPEIATLMEFVAGGLDEPYAVVVATHAAMCEACREQLRRIEVIGGALLEAEQPAAVPAAVLANVLAAVEAGGGAAVAEAARPDVAAPLARFLPNGLAGIRWKFSGPGVDVADLPSGSAAQGRLLLLKVSAGRKVPEHSHGGQELTLILSGAYRDRFGLFATGDIADHDGDVEHQPIAEAGEDCICLVAVNARLSFRSRIVRMLQPLFGL